MPALALPNADLDWLRRRVSNFSEDRPGVYHLLGSGGRVIYVGKAKAVRTRILSYFRARFPEDKAARGGPEPNDVPLPVEDMDEMLLLVRWFKKHPSAMRRTVAFSEWTKC